MTLGGARIIRFDCCTDIEEFGSETRGVELKYY